jgi:WD40 repeat protein
MVTFPSKRPDNDPDYDESVFDSVDLATGKRHGVYRFRQFDGLSRISDDGRKLLSWYGEVQDAVTGTRVSELEWPRDFAPQVISFSPDGHDVRAIDREGSVRTWATSTGKLLNQTKPSGQRMSGAPMAFDTSGNYFFRNYGLGVEAYKSATSDSVGVWTPTLPAQTSIVTIPPKPGVVLLRTVTPTHEAFAILSLPPVTEFRPRELPKGGPPTTGRAVDGKGDIRGK